MPPGFFHQNIQNACYIIAVPTSIYLTIQNPIFGIGTILGYGFGRYCGPDWDCGAIMNKNESNMIHELKPIGYLLYGISSIYGAIFIKFHRSAITHFPVLSTFIRYLFVFWWIGLLYYFNIIQFDWWQIWFGLGFLFGGSESDLNHWLCDKIWPESGPMFIKQEEERRKKKYRRN